MRGHRYTKRLGFAALDRLGLILLVGLSVLLMIGWGSNELGPAEGVGKEVDKVTVAVGKQLDKNSASIQEAGKTDAN